MRETVFLIGHWASCNMGDKYQAIVIDKSLVDKYDFKFVNFVDNNGEPMDFEFDGHLHVVYGPSELFKFPDCQLGIMTTGSMDKNSPYVGWVTNIIRMRHNLRRFIVWGGFSRGYEEFEMWASGLDFLRDSKVMFVARSYLDLKLYRALVNDDNKGVLGGDPMCWWSSLEGLQLAQKLTLPLASTFPNLSGTVAIVSIHCFEYDRYTLWDEIIKHTDFIIAIDTYGDAILAQKYPHIIVVNQPWLLVHLLKNVSHVISGRLHGAIIASTLNIPTTLIAIDDPEPEKGSLKFEAIGRSALGPDLGLCRVLNADYVTHNFDQLFNHTELHSTHQYINLTKITLLNLVDWLSVE